MQPPELVNMFAVPFAFSRYPAHAQLNPALKRYILEQEARGTTANPRPLTRRNAALFESHFNLFRDADPAVQELKTFCWDQLLAVIGRLNMKDAEFRLARVGGVFGRSYILDSRADDLISRIVPGARLGVLEQPPALGAARVAMRQARAQGTVHGRTS